MSDSQPPMTESTTAGSSTRADDVSTTLGLLALAARQPGLIGLGVLIAFGFGLRVVAGGFSVVDAVAVALLVVLVGPVEWSVHRYLFHAPASSFQQRRLGTGRGHRLHHRDPHDLAQLLLGSAGTAVFAVAIALVAVLVAVPLGLAAGADLGSLVLTAVPTAWFLLARYEVVHLAHHTRRRPWTARGRRIRAHHLAHHHRHPRALLGVTTRLPDHVFGPLRPARTGR